MKSLDQKLNNILANPGSAGDFIIADAKDADMGQGLAATGFDPHTRRPRSLVEYRAQAAAIVKQALVDIVLMSPSTAEVLTVQQRLFDGSTVTPAVRANDTSDIYGLTGTSYTTQPSRPFRSATMQQLRAAGPDLGLYSITPNNDVELDLATLSAFKQFRAEAIESGFRYFLEVFDPPQNTKRPRDIGSYVNDWIARTLAGVLQNGRPLFLKIAYHGPESLEALVNYDPTLVVGIMGGSSGTTHDAFKMLQDARKHGARAALYGRKINFSEDQPTFITFLRAIADGQINAIEAVKAYHGELAKLKIKPYRALKKDLELTDRTLKPRTRK